jgi:hypothetical protein
MSGATANHACIYSTIHKDNREYMTKGKYFYCQDEFLRAIEDISVRAKTNTLGCKYESLVKIPLHNIVIDELHLMLRITDRMKTNLNDDAVDLDDKEKNGNLPKQKQPNIDTLVKCINKCGVTRWLHLLRQRHTDKETALFKKNLKTHLFIRKILKLIFLKNILNNVLIGFYNLSSCFIRCKVLRKCFIIVIAL